MVGFSAIGHPNTVLILILIFLLLCFHKKVQSKGEGDAWEEKKFYIFQVVSHFLFSVLKL